MIGCGIFGRPWLYRRIVAALRGDVEPESPPPREILAVARWHFEGLCEVFGGSLASILQRRYTGWYVKGVHGAAAIRARFVRVHTPEEFVANWVEVDNYFAQLEDDGKIERTPVERLYSPEGSIVAASPIEAGSDFGWMLSGDDGSGEAPAELGQRSADIARAIGASSHASVGASSSEVAP